MEKPRSLTLTWSGRDALLFQGYYGKYVQDAGGWRSSPGSARATMRAERTGEPGEWTATFRLIREDLAYGSAEMVVWQSAPTPMPPIDGAVDPKSDEADRQSGLRLRELGEALAEAILDGRQPAELDAMAANYGAEALRQVASFPKAWMRWL